MIAYDKKNELFPYFLIVVLLVGEESEIECIGRWNERLHLSFHYLEHQNESKFCIPPKSSTFSWGHSQCDIEDINSMVP